MKHFTEYISEFLVSGHTAKAYDYVDLDLPSGTLWATCNIGANSPEEYGDYYMFGLTEPTTDIVSRTKNSPLSGGKPYLDENTINKLLPNVVDSKGMLIPEVDPATVHLGNKWRTPSFKHLRELRENTVAEKTSYNNVDCFIFRSKSNPDNFIVIPCGGFIGPAGKHEEGESFIIGSNQLYKTTGRLFYVCRSMGPRVAESSERIVSSFNIRPIRT